MGSCVSKKAARAGAGARSKVAAPLPVAEKESSRALPPVAEVVDEEEEEVKEVVLSEPPAPPRPPSTPPEPVKQRQPELDNDEELSAPSEACSASDGGASSVDSTAAAMEKAKAKAKLLHKQAGAEPPEAEKKAPRKGRTAAAPPEERDCKVRGAGNARGRSPSPSSAHRRQQQQPPAPRPRREQPPVVSGFGCRSGRFSPSAARRAAESAAVRRTHSAREADMALPSKRSLSAAINGSAAISRRDAGERSGRRSDSPTGRRSPSAAHRAASPMRKAAKEHGHGTPERASRPRGRDGDEQPALAGGGGGGERKKVAEGEEGALSQNPSVAMECFIFL